MQVRRLLCVGCLAATVPGAGRAVARTDDDSLGLRHLLTADAGSRSILDGAGGEADPPVSASAFIQFRYVADYQDQQDGEENLSVGFVNSRTRVGLKGSLGEKRLSYFVWFGFTGSGASLLLDAWAKWQVSEDLAVRVGQFKLPTWHEWTVSETRETFVERSVLDARFSQLYSQGVELVWQRDALRFVGAFSDGLRSWNVSGSGDSLGDQWALTGRAELLLDGSFAQRDDFESFRDEDPLFVIGVAGHVQDGATTSGAGTTNIYRNGTRITQWTADAQRGFGGWSLYGAVIGNHEERPGGQRFDQIGVLLQAQAFVTDDVQVFARYEWGDLDGEAALFALSSPGATINDELSLLTLGVTRFLAGHALKLTADAGVAFDEVSGAWRGAGAGWQGDDVNAGAEFVIRAQFQALF